MERKEEVIELYNDTLMSLKKTKTIAVLLDLAGTSDYIDDQKASIFINQLDILREKFNADLGIISISTHYDDSSAIECVLNIIARNLSEKIKIGTSFYYGGIYEYDTRTSIPYESNFNYDKVSTFDRYYVNDLTSSNQWFAVIDDSISCDVYKRYKDNHPMLLCRPSCSEYDIKDNCFMSIATTTKGFDGVIEVLGIYIDSINNLSAEQILETQRNMITHLSSYELRNIFRNKEYSFVEKYFRDGHADSNDYIDILKLIGYTVGKVIPTCEELIQLKNILELMLENFQSTNQDSNIVEVEKLQKSLFYGK